jgi:tripartite-type tricarboxylate transporter receptor subunit TctC
MMTKRLFVLALVTAAIGITGANLATAQVFPSRPITMVVPFAAGGPVDVLGRVMAERMKVSLGQPVIIENVTGAGGSVGVGRVARERDGERHLRRAHAGNGACHCAGRARDRRA